MKYKARGKNDAFVRSDKRHFFFSCRTRMHQFVCQLFASIKSMSETVPWYLIANSPLPYVAGECWGAGRRKIKQWWQLNKRLNISDHLLIFSLGTFSIYLYLKIFIQLSTTQGHDLRMRCLYPQLSGKTPTPKIDILGVVLNSTGWWGDNFGDLLSVE